MRNRMRNRYFADKRIMEIYHIKEDLTREATDEIEQALIVELIIVWAHKVKS